jgi:hypothetical protein
MNRSTLCFVFHVLAMFLEMVLEPELYCLGRGGSHGVAVMSLFEG